MQSTILRQKVTLQKFHRTRKAKEIISFMKKNAMTRQWKHKETHQNSKREEERKEIKST